MRKAIEAEVEDLESFEQHDVVWHEHEEVALQMQLAQVVESVHVGGEALELVVVCVAVADGEQVADGVGEFLEAVVGHVEVREAVEAEEVRQALEPVVAHREKLERRQAGELERKFCEHVLVEAESLELDEVRYARGQGRELVGSEVETSTTAVWF